MYFSLLNHCFLAEGKEKSVIYNLKERKTVELDCDSGRLAAFAEAGNELDSSQEQAPVFRKLEEMGWGFFSEQRYYIDKIRPYNRFTLTRPDISPENPQAAYLQLNHTCSLGTEACEKRFCSPCRCSEQEQDLLSAEEWLPIIDILFSFGVRMFLLTGGCVLEYDGLKKLYSHIWQIGASPVLIINRLTDSLRKIDREIPIILYPCVFPYSFDEIQAATEGFQQVTLLSEQDFPEDDHITLVKIKPSMQIGREDFIYPDIDEFYLRKDRDRCLYGKVFVRSNGDVTPCFQPGQPTVGNLKTDSARTVIRRLAETYWRKNTEISDKCSMCEWFYACPSCKAMPEDTICPML